MRCPGGQQLAAWVDREADVSVSAHLDECARCARLVQGHRQVKRRTAGLSVLPAPAPGRDLMSCLLTVPVAEHTRERVARTASAGSWSRPAGVALGALATVGLVTVTWMAPVATGAGGAGSAGPAAPTQAPVTAPPAAPTAPLTLVRWSPTDP